MPSISFRQVDKRVGLIVGLGFLAIAFPAFFILFGIGRLTEFANAFPSMKLFGILAAVIFILPPLLMVRRLYKATEVEFGSDAIVVRVTGREGVARFPYAEIDHGDLHTSVPNALSLFARDGRLLHRFAPFNDPASLDALVAGLVRTDRFRVEARPVKVFGGALDGRILTRKV